MTGDLGGVLRVSLSLNHRLGEAGVSAPEW